MLKIWKMVINVSKHPPSHIETQQFWTLNYLQKHLYMANITYMQHRCRKQGRGWYFSIRLQPPSSFKKPKCVVNHACADEYTYQYSGRANLSRFKEELKLIMAYYHQFCMVSVIVGFAVFQVKPTNVNCLQRFYL